MNHYLMNYVSFIILLCFSLSIISYPLLIPHSLHTKTRHTHTHLHIDRFIFYDFDATAPISSFLPGMAGVFGKPVQAFSVNRGQGIASFGMASKDFPLLEFNSSNEAYQLTPYIGFRTFNLGSRGG
jgi:hypothetical protein